MASGAFIVPNKAKLNVANATALLSLTSNWMLALLTSTFAPNDGDAGNEVYGDLTNELATANGYTSGGIALTSVALSGPSAGVIKFTCAAAVWTASGGSIPAWRYGYLYQNATVNSKVKPILAHFLGDSTPADIPATTSGNTLTVTMNASGILTLS
jgi:hypothetical protein